MRNMKEAGRFAGVVSWERGKRWSMDGRDSRMLDSSPMPADARSTQYDQRTMCRRVS